MPYALCPMPAPLPSHFKTPSYAWVLVPALRRSMEPIESIQGYSLYTLQPIFKEMPVAEPTIKKVKYEASIELRRLAIGVIERRYRVLKKTGARLLVAKPDSG